MARKYDNWLKAFVEHTAFGEAPISFYFWTGVSCISGALRRQVWIDQKSFKWIPNFYIILVAPPGIVSKTTTASVGMRILRKVPGIHFGPDVVTWQRLVQSMGQALEMFELPGGAGDDVMSRLRVPMSAITIESGEFGNLLNPADKEMVDVLVSLWDGKEGVFHKGTKTQGDDKIENPFINIIACTTPSWIENNFPEYMIGGGFVSRCIFVFAQEKRNYVAYPSRSVHVDYESQETALVEDLKQISRLKGEYVLSEDAFAWGEQWYRAHYETKPTHISAERFGGYLARKQTHIHKLAMVMSASQSDELVIHADILSAANDLVTALEHDMPKVFDKIGTTPESRNATAIISIVQSRGQIEVNELFRLMFRQMGYDEFQRSLNSAIKSGHIGQFPTEGKTMIRGIKQ